ncbi:MAG: NeuD/PglB/VioB family sugar acetyltransferase [Actinomycetota bacterium]
MSADPGCVVLGAGGHAKVVIELLQTSGRSVAYCVGGADGPRECLGIEVLCGYDELGRLRAAGHRHAFPAVGDNALRRRLAAEAIDAGFELVNAISPSAVVSPSARLGVGVAVMAGVVINAATTIGDLAIINTGATVDHDGSIGTAAFVGPQCALAGTVTVGDDAFIGTGTAVIPTITIGAGATVGAGSLVIRNIPPGAMA